MFVCEVFIMIRHLSYLIVLVGMFLTVVSSCDMHRDPEIAWRPEFKSVTAETQSESVVLRAEMTSSIGITECGFCYEYPSEAFLQTSRCVMNNGCFELHLEGLAPGATYMYRAYVGNGRNTIYSDFFDFTTSELQEDPLPEVPEPEDPEPEDPGKDDTQTEYTLSLPFDFKAVKGDAVSFDIEVGGNADFVVDVPWWTGCENGEGLSYELDGRKCTFYLEENNTSLSKEWQVDFTSTDHGCICPLYIYQVPKVSDIELSTYELVVGPEAANYNIVVYNLRDWSVSWPEKQNWIQNWNHPGELRLAIDRNPSTEDRIGYIMVGKEYEQECLVKILQKGGDVEIPEFVTVDIELPYNVTEFYATVSNIETGEAEYFRCGF